MSRFITTTEISFEIEQLIKTSEYYVLLITPFLKIHSRLKLIIKDKVERSNVRFYFACRKNELKNDELVWLKSVENSKLIFVENLHAKCYANEKTFIITSMNLYDYSMVNNIEFGFLLRRGEGGREGNEQIRQINNECRNILGQEIDLELFTLRSNCYENSDKVEVPQNMTPDELNQFLKDMNKIGF